MALPKNIAASVRARLNNLARARELPFQEVLQRFAIERFLARLSCSEYSERFVLKGAQMLVAWRSERIRPTLDIDMLGYIENDLDTLKTFAQTLCADKREDDGLRFDSDSVKPVRIKEDADYEGVRLTFFGYLGSARVPMQIDIGFNDAVTPEPEAVSYPSLLDMEEPRLRGYTRESAIAEKVEAMIKLGEINSRMKDFFDVWALSRGFRFTLSDLVAALTETCGRRRTDVTGLPVLLRSDFVGMPEKQVQWSAFLRKSRIDYAPAEFVEIVAQIRAFMGPVIASLAGDDVGPESSWAPAGPWT
jgi:hypothetical protein